MQRMRRWQVAIVLGILLILAGLAVEGLAAFPHLVQHVVSDLTADLPIHAFIAGWVLLAYGLVRALRQRSREKR